VYGKVLFLDGEIQSAESDEAIYHEHLVHPVLNATADRSEKRVLIVGGGEGATAREVLKWSAESVAHVDWVDIDGDLVNLCRRHMSWADDHVYNDQRLRYFAADIREFWATNNTMYDVIILDLPDPDVDALRELRAPGDAVNYPLYSRRFMEVLESRLEPHGVFVSHAGPVAPGGNAEVSRSGLHWLQTLAQENRFRDGTAYHTFIPSFQSEWGFYMSVAPSRVPHFPEGLAVMDVAAQDHACFWPRHWSSPFIGHVGTAGGAGAAEPLIRG